jgi:hypothetical protein
MLQQQQELQLVLTVQQQDKNFFFKDSFAYD